MSKSIYLSTIFKKKTKKRRYKSKRDITIPLPKISRNTIYFDESGEEKMPNKKIAMDDPDRYFIYSAVVANNHDFDNLGKYYFQLKYKYLGSNGEFHSSEFFLHETKKKKAYIKALADFIDTIPFIFLTVIVDKKKLYQETKLKTPKNPMATSFKKALSISIGQGVSDKDFYELSVKDVLKNISQYSFPDISNYYPLKIAYKTVIESYFNQICPAIFKEEYTNYEDLKPPVSLCFETSPNRERILKYTEIFRNQMEKEKRTDSAENIFRCVYDISFPFKKARYLGLELADLIGYGYSLKKRKRLSKVPLYRPIREVLLRREKVTKSQLGINSVIKI